jgi:hypothetical protein
VGEAEVSTSKGHGGERFSKARDFQLHEALTRQEWIVNLRVCNGLGVLRMEGGSYLSNGWDDGRPPNSALKLKRGGGGPD